MFVSVVICTYRRADDLRKLLACLNAQTYRDFEVLVVDGSGEATVVRDALADIVHSADGSFPLRWIPTLSGLPRQRNAGLRESRGDLICFLDDDVTIDPRTLEQVVELFQKPEFADVGGIGGRSASHKPAAMTLRWRMRRWLRIIPKLPPGQVDRFGRSVPLEFMQPFFGCRPAGYLSGFCMVYRRAAVSHLAFDEELPTYGGEDQDFSMLVGQHWRLMLCGDLQVHHHCSAVNRVKGVRQVGESAFGRGRIFAKRAPRWCARFLIARCVLGDLLIDLVAFARHPSRDRLATARARATGIVAGYRSVRRPNRQTHIEHEHDPTVVS